MSKNIIRVVESRETLDSYYRYTFKVYTRQDSLYITYESTDLEQLLEKIQQDIGAIAIESYKSGETVIVQFEQE
jgi:hypothetical protein